MTLLKTRQKEFRAAPVQMTGEDSFTVIACVYGVVDDYNTRFIEGCFDEYASKRLPTFVWSHDWAEPIGRTTNARSGELPGGGRGWLLDVLLDAVPAVPRAMQAKHQLESKTLTDVSVGFTRRASEEADDGVTNLTECECDEVSVVLVGAVPGAKVLMSRSGKAMFVNAEVAGNILTRLQQGQVDLHEALGELKAAAVEGENDDGTEEAAEESGKEKDGSEAEGNDDNDDESSEVGGSEAEEEELDSEDIEQALGLTG